jgi:hypothetical protein
VDPDRIDVAGDQREQRLVAGAEAREERLLRRGREPGAVRVDFELRMEPGLEWVLGEQ